MPIVFHARRGGESKLTSHIVREGMSTPWRLRFSKPKDSLLTTLQRAADRSAVL